VNLFRRDWRSLALRCLDALVRCEARDDLTPYVDALASLRDACEQEIRDVSAPPEEGFYAGAAAGQGGADLPDTSREGHPAGKVADHTHRGSGF
jgi:hypothetical protein